MRTVETRRHVLPLTLALTAGVVLAAVLLGMRSISWLDVWRGTRGGLDAEIIWRIRLPRVCLGFLAGAVLAVGGLAMQALFRNPLATPYTLGISSGASVGSALYMRLGLDISMAGISGLSIFAWVAAAATTALVFGLARVGRAFSSATLLLIGVAVSFSFASVVLLIQYVGDVTTSFRIGRWLMGGLEVVGFGAIWQLAPFAVAGLAIILATPRDLDLLSMGDEAGASRGLAVARVKVRTLAAVSTMVAGVVAVCGPIGFVGLIVPHVGRLLIGPKHERLAPVSLLGGGAFLVLCDLAARTIVAPVEIPVGIVTALLGGPFFVTLLLRQCIAARRERGIH